MGVSSDVDSITAVIREAAEAKYLRWDSWDSSWNVTFARLLGAGIAAELAGDRAMHEAEPALWLMVQGTPAPHVIFARALAMLGDRRARPILQRALLEAGDDDFTAQRAAEGLAVLGDPSGFPRVHAMLQRGDEPAGKRDFLSGIFALPYFLRFPDLGATEILLELAKDERPWVRATLTGALARKIQFAGPQAEQVLQRLAMDPYTFCAANGALDRLSRAIECERYQLGPECFR